MKSVLKSNLSFLFPFAVFIVAGAIVLFSATKSDLHLTINSFHSHFFDVFFSNITYLGDGVFALSIAIVFLFIKYRYAFIIGLSYALSSLFTQLLKHTLFDNMVRPKKFFEGIHDLHFVPGVENHLLNSFPSGHATTAFALCFSLSLIVKNNSLKFILFVVALLVGFSRVYLSQHFFGDIYAGSLIGVIVTFLVYITIQRSNKSWLNRSFTIKSDK